MNPYREDVLLNGMLETRGRFVGLAEDLERLLADVSGKRPAAISLVGPRGLGKSFMLRVLADPRGARQLWPAAIGPAYRDDPGRLLFVMKDFSSFSPARPLSLLPILLDCLLDTLAEALEVEDARLLPLERLPRTRAASLADLRRRVRHELALAREEASDAELRDQFAETLGHQLPDALIALLGRLDEWGLRVVFLLDEFDTVASVIERDDYDHLRVLLGAASFVITAARALSEVVEEDVRSSPFFNLLQRLNLVSLHFLAPDDARRLVQEPPTWHPWSQWFTPSEADVDAILAMTGLHPDLILVSCENLYAWLRRHHAPGADLIGPAELPYLRARLGTLFADFFAVLWHQVNAEERRALLAIANDRPIDPAALPPALVSRGYVTYANGQYHLFAGLFREYVQAQSEPVPAPERPDDALDESLTDLERRLLNRLKSRAGEVVSREEIIAALYEQELDANEARGRLDALVFRLRSKLEGAPLRIESVRNQGYRLVRL